MTPPRPLRTRKRFTEDQVTAAAVAGFCVMFVACMIGSTFAELRVPGFPQADPVLPSMFVGCLGATATISAVYIYEVICAAIRWWRLWLHRGCQPVSRWNERRERRQQ